MADRLKEIPAKVLEWWNKFTAKQKTAIICIAAGVIMALAILVTALTRPQWIVLANCETTSEASTITELLEEENIIFQTSPDGLRIEIHKQDESRANILLGANGIPSAPYSIANVTGGGLSVTESDKQKNMKVYLEKKLETDLQSLQAVKNAFVELSLPDNDGTLIAKEEESYARVILELDGDFTQEQASNLARSIATQLGNTTTKNVVIIDTYANLLFSGEEDYSIAGSANSQLVVKQQAEKLIQDSVKKVLLGTNEYTNVEVSSNLTLDFSTTNQVDHNYRAQEGRTEGLLSHEDLLESESTGSSGGVPGTDSNNSDTTTYNIPDTEESSSTITERSSDYLPDESITDKNIPPGTILYDESSVSVAAIKYRVIREEEAATQGLLDGVSWEEYKLANSERTRLEVDPDFVTMVANATGIAEENVVLVAYEEPMFVDREGNAVSASDIMTIVLIVVILALLGFVIFRSLQGEKAEPEEEELSVESLLQSTPESELEDIEIDMKSDTRKMIEKFVDDNPEAVANLLRNWLSEDWG